MSASEPKSARSTLSSQLTIAERNPPDDHFGVDDIPAVSSPKGEAIQPQGEAIQLQGEAIQPQGAQDPPNSDDVKENTVYKSKFPTNLWTTNDELLRLYYINKLEKSQLIDWPHKWSFLLEEYKALSNEMTTKKKSKDEIRRQIDQLKKIFPPEASQVPKSSQLGPVPETSSGMVGWKASQKEYVASKYPSYLWQKNCTDSFEKQMKWPLNSQR